MYRKICATSVCTTIRVINLNKRRFKLSNYYFTQTQQIYFLILVIHTPRGRRIQNSILNIINNKTDIERKINSFCLIFGRVFLSFQSETINLSLNNNKT